MPLPEPSKILISIWVANDNYRELGKTIRTFGINLCPLQNVVRTPQEKVISRAVHY